MFGQNNNDQSQQQTSDPAIQDPMLQNSTPPAGFLNPSEPPSPVGDPVQDVTPPPATADEPTDQPDDQGAPMIMDDNPTSFVAPATPADVADESDSAAELTTPNTPANSDDLLSMKQEALQQLTPLVNHLDQSPEEKFRTVMMMIQAADDHTKLSEAFEAAKQIPDDKSRAQALLDVINEINYFTQHQN
jgi:hypothetical protein